METGAPGNLHKAQRDKTESLEIQTMKNFKHVKMKTKGYVSEEEVKSFPGSGKRTTTEAIPHLLYGGLPRVYPGPKYL